MGYLVGGNYAYQLRSCSYGRRAVNRLIILRYSIVRENGWVDGGVSTWFRNYLSSVMIPLSVGFIFAVEKIPGVWILTISLMGKHVLPVWILYWVFNDVLLLVSSQSMFQVFRRKNDRKTCKTLQVRGVESTNRNKGSTIGRGNEWGKDFFFLFFGCNVQNYPQS